jgi:hypothetical protein
MEHAQFNERLRESCHFHTATSLYHDEQNLILDNFAHQVLRVNGIAFLDAKIGDLSRVCG